MCVYIVRFVSFYDLSYWSTLLLLVCVRATVVRGGAGGLRGDGSPLESGFGRKPEIFFDVVPLGADFSFRFLAVFACPHPFALCLLLVCCLLSIEKAWKMNAKVQIFFAKPALSN